MPAPATQPSVLLLERTESDTEPPPDTVSADVFVVMATGAVSGSDRGWATVTVGPAQ